MKLCDLAEDVKIDNTETNEDLPPEDNWKPVYNDTENVRADVFPQLKAKIEKLNKRAKKIGVPPIILSINKEFTIDVNSKNGDDTKPKYKEKWYEVKVEGAAPQIEGYKFLATIQHTDSGNVIRTVPGEETNENIKKFYEARPDYCDHCKKKRHRIDTFIVQDKEGNMRQVGRNCLADFLGGMDPKAILFYFKFRGAVQNVIDEENEKGPRGGRGNQYISVDSILEIGAALVRTYGYKRATDKFTGERNDDSTSVQVRTVLFPPLRAHQDAVQKKWIEIGDAPTQQDKETVENILTWWNSVPQQEKDNNQFLHNVDVLVKGKDVTPRDIGFVVALFPTYHRATAVAKEKQVAAKKSNEWVGVVGQKIPPTKIKVIRTHEMDSQYGYGGRIVQTTQICAMEDQAGNMFTWFNSSANKLEKDREYTIVGTVKKQDDYKGRKQTTLTRVKAQPVEGGQVISEPQRQPQTPQQPAEQNNQ